MKIHSLSGLSLIARELRADGSRVVMAHGCFDLLHIGHIRHLQAARALGDVLAVTVTPARFVNKGPGRPRFSDAERLDALAALECVDYVAVNEWPTAAPAIRLLQPHVFAKGVEYRDYKTAAILEEEDAVAEIGGRVAFTGEVLASSTELLKSMPSEALAAVGG